MTSIPPEIDLPPDHILRQLLDAIAAHPEVREPLLRALLTEDFLALPKRLDKLQGEFEEFREETRAGFRAVNERIDATNAELRTLSSEVRTQGSELHTLSSEVRTQGSELHTLSSEVRTQGSELHTLSSEVRTQGSELHTLSSEVRTLSSEVRTQGSELHTLSSEVRTQGSDLHALSSEVRTLSSVVRTQGSELHTLGSEVRTLGQRVDDNTRVIRRLEGHVGRLIGDAYEDKCRYNVGVILDGWLDGPVVADRSAINAKLLDARRNGAISRQEYQDGLNPDIIARGVEDTDQTAFLAIVEASVTFNQDDLETAARRAAVIAKATGIGTAAFMATHFDWPDEVSAAARQLGVTIIRFEDTDYQDIE